MCAGVRQLGAVMADKLMPVGYGNRYGDVEGYGNGYGNVGGYGNRYGDVEGYGYGYGNGYGYGYGDGYGDGYGNGFGSINNSHHIRRARRSRKKNKCC